MKYKNDWFANLFFKIDTDGCFVNEKGNLCLRLKVQDRFITKIIKKIFKIIEKILGIK